MLDTEEGKVETTSDLEKALTEARRDVCIPVSHLVTALGYRFLDLPASKRLEYACQFLELTQLDEHDVAVLCRTATLRNLPDDSVSRFLTTVTDHHACSPAAVIQLLHGSDNPKRLVDLWDRGGDLPIGVGLATAQVPGGTLTQHAVTFTNHVLGQASPVVSHQLALLLEEGWSTSLWEAYEAVAAAWDEKVTLPVDYPEDWLTDLET